MTKRATAIEGSTTLSDPVEVRGASATFFGQPKGGSGKTFSAAAFIDLLSVRGIETGVVQVDEQRRLEALYPGRVTTVGGASLAEVRRDPGAIVAAFDPLYSAFEQMIADGVALVVDVGSLNQHTLEEYVALIDADEDLVAAGVRGVWFIPTTAEPESMRGAIRTAEAVGRVLPSFRRLVLLNGRDGPFKFYPNSPADVLWRSGLEPLCRELGTVELPAISPGSWAPFETTNRRFIDVVGAEVADIQRWTGRSRPAAKVLRGDVATFLAAADAAFAPILDAITGGGE